MPFTAVLLDLDGTLLDTIPDLANAANAMRQELDLPVLAPETIANYVGKGTEHLVMRALSNNPAGQQASPDEVRHGLEIFERHYRQHNGKAATVYPGALEGLQAFNRAGMKMAVVTNKPTEFTLPLLKHFGMDRYFEHVVSGDTCAQKKPHPMPLLHACDLLGVRSQDALAIGDSVNDALAARAAKITVLAVPYGYNEGMDVRTLEVDDIVMSIAEAAQWAARH